LNERKRRCTIRLFKYADYRATGQREGTLLWKELEEAWSRFEDTQASGEAARAASALNRLRSIIREGEARASAQIEAKDLMERKRLLEGQQVLRATEALTFAARMSAIVRRRISEHIGGTEEERAILAGISEDVAGLIRSDVGELG
jgi:hypothetical protein